MQGGLRHAVHQNKRRCMEMNLNNEHEPKSDEKEV